ncbi:MAG: DNA repair protein RadC [Lachnospiraceae bacterium]|nr:DNA repair protein RadC [Lachnospiraceae bacterium]
MTISHHGAVPDDSRPYERCQRLGPQALTDAELLAVILRTGRQGADAETIGREILAMTKDEGLAGIGHLTLQKLLGINGVGTVKAIQLLCIGELSRRIAKSSVRRPNTFDSPAVIADYYMEDLRHREQEVLMLLMLDARHRLIEEKTLTVGTVNCSLVSVREIFHEALGHNAVSLILMHNHPSGDPHPSQADILTTEKVRRAGLLMEMPLLDHIIIGDHTYYSFKEDGFYRGEDIGEDLTVDVF